MIIAKDEPLAARIYSRDLSESRRSAAPSGEGKILSKLIESDRVPSYDFWGPPGVGKDNTCTQIIASKTKANFITFLGSN